MVPHGASARGALAPLDSARPPRFRTARALAVRRRGARWRGVVLHGTPDLPPSADGYGTLIHQIIHYY